MTDTSLSHKHDRTKYGRLKTRNKNENSK